jgi:DNA-binding transcriptional MerR regulator/methylmalonyl-CoA mutase cobalamin-binding subunit
LTGPAEPTRGPYRIQVAAEISGVPSATLRAWERRYGVPVPRRTAAAYRLYTHEDVAQIQRMRELVEAGVSPAEAARVVLGSPVEGATPAARAVSPPVLDDAMLDGLGTAQQRILEATARWDAAAIDAELARLSMLLDAQTLYENIVSPVIVEVGERWARGEMSIAHEHLLSERVEITLRAALRALEHPDGPVVVIACVDAELHVLGALGAALHFASQGARIVMLGAMTPPSAIADAVRGTRPRLVGLSMSLPPATAPELFSAYAKACAGTPWVVGGAASAELRAEIEDAGGMVAVGRGADWRHAINVWLSTSP